MPSSRPRSTPQWIGSSPKWSRKPIVKSALTIGFRLILASLCEKLGHVQTIRSRLVAAAPLCRAGPGRCPGRRALRQQQQDRGDPRRRAKPPGRDPRRSSRASRAPVAAAAVPSPGQPRPVAAATPCRSTDRRFRWTDPMCCNRGAADRRAPRSTAAGARSPRPRSAPRAAAYAAGLRRAARRSSSSKRSTATSTHASPSSTTSANIGVARPLDDGRRHAPPRPRRLRGLSRSPSCRCCAAPASPTRTCTW